MGFVGNECPPIAAQRLADNAPVVVSEKVRGQIAGVQLGDTELALRHFVGNQARRGTLASPAGPSEPVGFPAQSVEALADSVDAFDDGILPDKVAPSLRTILFKQTVRVHGK